MKPRVFLGGSCSHTTWRKDVAIPVLEGAGIGYFNPQLPAGEWNDSRVAVEALELAACDVALWVITGTTRGVASVAEAVCYLAEGRPIVIAMEMVGEASLIDGRQVCAVERSDLNRGRLFLRSVASQYRAQIFSDVTNAVQHTIQLCTGRKPGVTMMAVRDALARISCGNFTFVAAPVHGGLFLQLEGLVDDVKRRVPVRQRGRKWYLDAHSSIDDVVRTAFKAIETWEEHELRERFLVDGRAVFSPHSSILSSDDRSPENR